MRERWSEFARPVRDGQKEIDWAGLQAQIEVELRRSMRREIQSNPLLVFLLQTSGESIQAPAEESVSKVVRKERRVEAAIAS